LTAVLAASFACGGDDDDDEGDDGGATATAEPTEDGDGGDGGGGAETFEVSMGDNFFDPDTLTVPAGATITINLTNDGAAIHNMRIGGEDNEYDTDDDAASDPDIVSAGETATLEWEVPDEPGDYDFRCDFHPTDMVGAIVVE
jgi:plastocyanin